MPGEIYSCKSRRKEFELIYDVFQMEATIKSIRDCWGKSASEAEEVTITTTTTEPTPRMAYSI